MIRTIKGPELSCTCENVFSPFYEYSWPGIIPESILLEHIRIILDYLLLSYRIMQLLAGNLVSEEVGQGINVNAPSENYGIWPGRGYFKITLDKVSLLCYYILESSTINQ